MAEPERVGQSDRSHPLAHLGIDWRPKPLRGVWHKDGALAQIRTMAAWSDREGIRDYPNRETLRKIAANLRAAADALDGTVGADAELTPRGRSDA